MGYYYIVTMSAIINEELEKYDEWLQGLDIDVSSYINTMWDVSEISLVNRPLLLKTGGNIALHVEGRETILVTKFAIRMGKLTLEG